MSLSVGVWLLGLVLYDICSEWCWLVLTGNYIDLLVTLSELSDSELQGELISVNHRQRKPLTICVRDGNSRLYELFIEPDCSYAVRVSLLLAAKLPFID